MEPILIEIERGLTAMRDVSYRDFQIGLIPTVGEERMIGVRTPELRKLAKELAKRGDVSDFLGALPHRFFEEDQLHAFIISGIRDFDRCAAEVSRFLPYVDNWATCDQTSPAVFKKHRRELSGYIRAWIASGETYAVRFAVKMLMDHFLDEDFDTGCAQAVAEIVSEEYYVNMMRAWYFATALAKQYDAVLPFIAERRLDAWTHNRAIQKAVESRRIPDDRKALLRTMRIR